MPATYFKLAIAVESQLLALLRAHGATCVQALVLLHITDYNMNRKKTIRSTKVIQALLQPVLAHIV